MSSWSSRAVHADAEVPRAAGAVSPPIVQTATFAADSAQEFAELALQRRGSGFYTRYGNPNHAQVAAVLADLEGAEAAMVFASGMATITTTVLALVRSGDHIVAQQRHYGGVPSLLLNLLPRFGVSCTQVDQTDPRAFAAAIRPETRLVLVESPSNPLLDITDLRAVSELARAAGALTIADNTFATPVNSRPLALGADLVWHSATKYLGGHSDLSAGVLAGPAEVLDRVWDAAIITGAVLGPIDAWLLLRGIRTLPLRVRQHNSNGLALARALEAHPAVAAVYYPGLPTHPQHRVAAAQMDGYGGVLSLELAGGYEAADRFIDGLRYARRAPSLGSVETLVVHPATMWQAILPPDQIQDAAMSPGLVRLSAGVEDTDDLVSDAIQSLNALKT
ncbi:trans-sulfuration enzyme family protein [Amorphoplanes digitatis]|uniref:homocysteine desulfhydrase n=1 Tax=Actinoplanes digitatis TaxID=1868 RepID=A0A7W7MSD8_9ACTN|nr:aminotransferase class I/II-fold pyridoxal phosphate-dependent enzyme [Actinoplanes digitatis]MBB4765218.1 methionine-gamma-lyase [Actinoplanes digitatis]GID94669.1 methionine gamma-lyase [Actinoplanes digitatis]